MDFANRGNRPTNAPQPSVQNDQQVSPAFQLPSTNKKKRKSINFGKLSSLVVLISAAVLLLAVIFAFVFFTGDREQSLIQEDKYQAVFLNSQDGQVYFGKLEVFNRDVYVLTDIYYVRVENPIQPEGANQQAQPNISLAKLGNELHGPQDAMFIRRDQVLYWENLKDDGQVVTAIKEFKATGEEQAPAPQPEQAAPAVPNPPTDSNNTQLEGTEEQDDTPTSNDPAEVPAP